MVTGTRMVAETSDGRTHPADGRPRRSFRARRGRRARRPVLLEVDAHGLAADGDRRQLLGSCGRDRLPGGTDRLRPLGDLRGDLRRAAAPRGTVTLKGRSCAFRGPWDAIAAGIGMMPEDRKEAGLFLSHSVADNIAVTVLDQMSPHGIVSEASRRTAWRSASSIN